MQDTDSTFIARTLKECMGYLLKDCEEAGFDVAALHLRIAITELSEAAIEQPKVAKQVPVRAKR